MMILIVVILPKLTANGSFMKMQILIIPCVLMMWIVLLTWVLYTCLCQCWRHQCK